MLTRLFAPGCGLMLYKPELAKKIHAILVGHYGDIEMLSVCCHYDPLLKEPTEIINICPGCDKRFRNNYQNSSTVSLWEVLVECDFFDFPDYHGQTMSIMDACPTRSQEQIHDAIRKLLLKMNISLAEPEHTRAKSICCGDSFYGVIPVTKVKAQMTKRASEMPVEDVVVYCVSCIKSMYIGGKKPRYLIDLLCGEETAPHTYEPEAWHEELDDYILKHQFPRI
jgi:Fe-S oxidoreductase